MQVTSANFSNFSINTQKAKKSVHDESVQDESFDEYMEVPSNFQRLGIDEKYTDKKDKKDKSSIAQENQGVKNIKLRPEVEALEAVIEAKAATSKKADLENSKLGIKADLKELTAKLVNAANSVQDSENSENLKLKFKDVLSQVLKEADDKSDLENSKKLNFDN